MSQNDEGDIPDNLSANEHFQSVVERAISRRGFLRMGVGASIAAFLGGATASELTDRHPADHGTGTPGRRDRDRFGFSPVASSRGDAVLVPPGYRAEVLAPWGAALFVDSPAWQDDGTNTGADQARQVGDNHDGMHFFPLDGQAGNEGLLVVNHEYTNYEYLFGAAYLTAWTADKVLKAQNAHGISVLHIRRRKRRWDIVQCSRYNRRLTGN